MVFFYSQNKERGVRTIDLNLKTSVTYTANGTQKQFDFPFDYLRKAFVYVSIDGVVQDMQTYIIENRAVYLTNAPASGSLVNVYRSTTTDRLVSWADASVLRAADMTIQQVQQLHVLEEHTDWIKVQLDLFKKETLAEVKELTDALEKYVNDVDQELRQYVQQNLTNFTNQVYERLAQVLLEVEQLVDRLNQTSKEELMEIAATVEKWALVAQKAALYNSRWPISTPTERDASKPTYGLDADDLIINVIDVARITVTGDSNPTL